MDAKLLVFMGLFSFLNRCRGTRFFDRFRSTTLTRIVASGLMALILALNHIDDFYFVLPYCWVTLFIWMVFGWDSYWSATIGNDPKHTKLWGILNLSWRMLLIAPCFVGVAFATHHVAFLPYILLTAFLWLPYYIVGSFSKPLVIPVSEFVVGAAIGALCLNL